MAEEHIQFQAETAKLLKIVIDSLYSEKQIFLRELISNAADACDRLRYAALTDPALAESGTDFRITIAPDSTAGTLTIADNGIGMSKDGLIADLGTIARSGSSAFVEELGADARKDVALIGQFGVGFYSGFMVADRIDVVSRRAGSAEAWRWSSDGASGFTVDEAEREEQGTSIILHLRKGEEEYLDPTRIRHIVKSYSDHIPIPIVLKDDKGEEAINEANALWTLPKSEISDQQYTEFYHHIGHAFDTPWLTLHFKAEGVIEYTCLLFVPSARPLDLFEPDRRNRVKLYVKRVFIADGNDELLPPWLRFLRGLVDSEDLPLNVSREMLQQNPVITKIRANIVKRVLEALAGKADKEPDDYAKFWEQFGPVLKEGLYEAPEQRERLLDLVRFRSTASDSFFSLNDYIGRMKPGQDAIFYITGEDASRLKTSPQLEGFKAKGIEVLLLTDPVDEFWLPMIGAYQEKPFKSVTRGDTDLSAVAGETEADAKGDAAAEPKDGDTTGADAKTDSLIALFKLTLQDAVKDVRVSHRLTDSPVCLVADEGDLDMHLEKLLRQHQQVGDSAKRILEINPGHAMIGQLAAMVGKQGADDRLSDAAWLLLDQARILQGETVPDPAAFSRRMTSFMSGGLGNAA